MDSTNKIYKIISYNVMSSTHLAGLLSIIELEKPDLILIQELLLDTENLKIFISGARGYQAASNVENSENSKKPGTGLIWHESLPIRNVTALEPNRLQFAYIGPYPIVNVYPPAGSDNGPGRRVFFRDQLFRVMRGLGTKLPILGGDWNSVINVKDIEGGDYAKKKSQDLADLVRNFNLTDAFRHLHPDEKEFTWKRKDKFGSRLDRFYLPQELLAGLMEVSHHAYLSDHKYTKMLVKLPEVEYKIRNPKEINSGSYWKLNCSILQSEDFMLEFQVLWDNLLLRKVEFMDIADWWDRLAKEECRGLCMRYSAMVARSKRGLKEMLMIMLECALDKKDWLQVAIIRGRLR